MPSNSKTRNYKKYSRPSLKSWLKKLFNEYIYAEQNPTVTRDIGFQSWPCCSQKWETLSLKFPLWRPVPKNWQVTRSFMVWFFLSWGVDCWTENLRSWFRRITLLNYNHPISHCVSFWISTSIYPLLAGRLQGKLKLFNSIWLLPKKHVRLELE